MSEITTPLAALREALPERDSNAHKYMFGRALLWCGSVGYTGAASMAAEAAVRSGAGLVTLAVPEAIYGIVAPRHYEAMVAPLPEGGEAAALLGLAERASAVLIGPGLGAGEATRGLVRSLVSELTCPIVLDADGINAFAGHIDLLAAHRGPLVLTPHDGELARLLGCESLFEGRSREQTALWLAERLNAVAVLKAHRTVTAAPDGRLCVNTTGNVGMAKGGSGDVLAGMLVSVLAAGAESFAAAAGAVYLHGLAGDIASEKYGALAAAPTDIIGCIGEATMRSLGWVSRQ